MVGIGLINWVIIRVWFNLNIAQGLSLRLINMFFNFFEVECKINLQKVVL